MWICSKKGIKSITGHYPTNTLLRLKEDQEIVSLNETEVEITLRTS